MNDAKEMTKEARVAAHDVKERSEWKESQGW